MRAASRLKHILHALLKKQCPHSYNISIKKRLDFLMVATESLFDGNQLL
jgi:hypothetical protein